MIAINCQYVRMDVVDLIEEMVETGSFACEIAWSETDNIFYFFTKTRWRKGRKMSLLMTKQHDSTSMVFQAINESSADTFDDETCPIPQEAWQNVEVTEWHVFAKVVYTAVNMAFIDLKKKLAGTDTQCVYGGDMTWLHPEFRGFLLKKVRESDPETQDREYEEFKRLAHETAQRYKKE